ncbi:hypothetical protein As57867_010456, partial [Aphanomyces stellatus]
MVGKSFRRLFKTKEQKLFEATEAGDVARVRDLLAKGVPDINQLQDDEWAPLHSAAYNGYVEILKELVDRGAPVDLAASKSKHFSTPFIFACWQGHIEAATYLLERGANVNGTNAMGYSALMCATTENRIEVVQFLLDADADTAIQSEKETALDIAFSRGHDAIAALLQKYGGVEQNNASATAVVFKAGSQEKKLFEATEKCDVARVLELLQQGIPNISKLQGDLTPLHMAASKGNVAILQAILDYGAPVELVAGKGAERNTPLIIASFNGHVDAVKLLCERGAKLNVANKNNITPLLAAVTESRVDVVHILLGAGADVNIRNADGTSPLVIASSKGNVDIINAILGHGGIDIADKDAAYAIAAKNGHTALVTILGADREKSFVQAIERLDVKLVRELLAKGVPDINKLQGEWAPLHVASSKGNVDIIKLLLDHSASVNGVAGDGGDQSTPLIIAASNGHVDACKLLMERGAKLTAANKKNNTPLLAAVTAGRVDIVRFLLGAGAEVNIRNIDNQSPLSIASEQGEADIVQLFLASGKLDNIDKDAAYDIAVKNDNASLLALLGLEREKMFFEAIESEDSAGLERIVAKGVPNINKLQGGLAALHMAATAGKVKLIEIILQSGAIVDVVASEDKDRNTPLILACTHGKLDVAKYLIERGAKLTATNKHLNTPLLAALSANQDNVARFLLDAGADVNVQNTAGKTSLWFASEEGTLDIAKTILAKCTLDNTDKDAAYDIAATKGYVELMALLGEARDTTFFQAVDRLDLKQVQDLLAKGVPNINRMQGPLAPLHAAAAKGNVGILNLLLDYDALVDQVTGDHEGCVTALFLASRNGHLDAVKVMCDHGANTAVGSKTNTTPLHIAVTENRLEVVRHLLAKGATANTQSRDGKSPLLTATENGNVDIVSALLAKGELASKYKDDAYNFAAKNGPPSILELLGAEREKTFFDALERLDVAALQAIVTKGVPDINKLQNGLAPLHMAATKGKVDVLKLLLDRGALVDMAAGENNDCNTPLMMACRHGHHEAVKFLFDRGAKLSMTNKNNNTPLLVALAASHQDVALYLLDVNAAVNVRNTEGRTPLSYASELGNLEILQAILAKGNVDNTDKDAAYDIAATKGHVAIAKILGGARDTKLYDAVTQLDIKLARDLLTKGVPDINRLQGGALAPIHVVASNGNLDILKLLLDHGAAVELVAGNGGNQDTPVIMAASNGHTNIVKLLIERGANLSATNKSKINPLHAAVIENRVDVVRVLLEAGADVNSLNAVGKTSLMVATEKGHVDIVQVLVASGKIDHAAKHAAFDIAAKNGHASIMELLGKEREKKFFEAIERLDTTGLRDILATGVPDINKLQDGFAPLHMGVAKGNIDIVAILLDHGAAVDVVAGTAKDQNTPLIIACGNGNLSAVEMLTERGAKLSATNEKNNTPLLAAVMENRVDVATFLLGAGADSSIKNTEGKTPLLLASEKGNVDMVKAILARASNFTTDIVTAINIAKKGGHAALVGHLHEEIEKVLFESIKKGDAASVQSMLATKLVDINKLQGDYAPLHMAAAVGNIEIVNLLLDHGATIDRIGSPLDRKFTALILASGIGHVEVAKALCARGANLNAFNARGNTPIMTAIAENRLEVVKYLLDAGADIKLRNNENAAVYDIALKRGNSGILERLDNEQKKKIAEAINKGDAKRVRELVAKGVPNINKLLGDVALLHIAAAKGNVDILKVLLDSGATVDVAAGEAKDRNTPLIIASSNGHLDAAKLLVERGAKLTAANKNNNTPLLAAVAESRVEVVLFLLGAGADVNVRNTEGKSPLLYATDKGNADIVKAILAKGVVDTTEYAAALDVASKKGHTAIADFLR